MGSILGQPYLVMPMLIFKVYGSQLLGRRMYKGSRPVVCDFGPNRKILLMCNSHMHIRADSLSGYKILCLAMTSICFLIGLFALITVVRGQHHWAAYLGQQACVYATTAGCSPLYEDIFLPNGDGTVPLSDVVVVFGVASVITCTTAMLRMVVATCCDFAFMAKTAVVSFLFYIPAIAIVRFAYPDNALAYFIAQYVPHFLHIVIFSVRCYQHFQTMDRNEPGMVIAVLLGKLYLAK